MLVFLPLPRPPLPLPAAKETLLLPLRFLPSSTGRPEIVAAGDTVLLSLLSRATLSLSENVKKIKKKAKFNVTSPYTDMNHATLKWNVPSCAKVRWSRENFAFKRSTTVCRGRELSPCKNSSKMARSWRMTK